MAARPQIALVILALLVMSCGGSDSVSADELPIPPGYFGECNPTMLAAIEYRDMDSVRMLRARRAVSNCTETQDALYVAIADLDAERLRLLLAAGVDPKAPLVSRSCSPPLAFAFRVRHGGGANAAIVRDTSMLKLLLDAGADFKAEWRSANCYHSSWRSAGRPLVVAVVAGDVEFARPLIEAGADVRHRNAGGLTALDFVPLGTRPESREAMTTLLRGAMARQRR